MRTTSPRQIIEKTRIRADMVHSEHTNDDEALLLLDDAYTELYALMAGCDESLFLKTTSLTLTDNQADLPSDLYKLSAVSYSMGGVIIRLDRIALQDRLGTQLISYMTNPVYYLQDNRIKCEGIGNTTIDLIYIPTPVEITDLDQVIQLVHNEDHYLQASLWRDMASREESDTRAAETMLALAVQRIKKTITPRSKDNTTIVDVYSNRRQQWHRGGVRK